MVNVVNLLAGPVSAPGGLWAIILNWIENTVVNYGWVIILFTLLIKVCMSPLDFLMKFTTKKQNLVQQKLAPQIARINQKYQNDKNQAQLQTNALYKKEGFNVIGSCVVMILNLAITMTVFLTLFGSLREMSAYKAINQYDALQTAYVQTYETNIGTAKTEFKNKFGT
ncbi:MAG: YidC/Oxa1 family membrane protein insertase, partial [Clostridia bacterium]|nr:YidC/Oxa1 family membrane protein insertase [Clostridia bacterium]